MAIDHSTTYRQWKLRNIPHRMRLRAIRLLSRSVRSGVCTDYVDVGCSNGFLTAIVADLTGAERVVGRDHNTENLAIAAQAHPQFEFSPVDLNLPVSSPEVRGDFVTCFETLEHVGQIRTALENLWKLTKPGGALVISVPVEVGVAGILKFLVKTLLYGYRLDELQPPPTWKKYFLSLLRGERISRYRDISASGWGTHFGFDYRDIDDCLKEMQVDFTAVTRGFTRFYVIQRPESPEEVAESSATQPTISRAA